MSGLWKHRRRLTMKALKTAYGLRCPKTVMAFACVCVHDSQLFESRGECIRRLREHRVEPEIEKILRRTGILQEPRREDSPLFEESHSH